MPILIAASSPVGSVPVGGILFGPSSGTPAPAPRPAVGYPTSDNGFACGSSPNWANSPDYLQSDDAQYAFYSFNSGSTDTYMCLTGFGFNIDSTAIIDGIKLEYESYEEIIFGGGFDVRDQQMQTLKGGVVGGTDKATNTDLWNLNIPTVHTYGSSTDLWGRTWQPSDINNNSGFGFYIHQFGFRYSGYIDYFKCSVYWHFQYDDTGSGGVLIGGTATLGGGASFTGAGGVLVGSTATTSYSYRISGGVTCGGTATVSKSTSITPTGGVVISGYWADLVPVSGGIKLGGSGSVVIGFVPTGSVRVSGEATHSYIAIGQANGTITFTTEADGLAIQEAGPGTASITFTTQASSLVFGGSLGTGGVLLGGTALSEGNKTNLTATGGAVFGGSAINGRILRDSSSTTLDFTTTGTGNATNRPSLSGGVKVGGTALNASITHLAALGGVLVGGGATIRNTLTMAISGGGRIGGVAEQFFRPRAAATSSIAISTTGTGLARYSVTATGAVLIGGTAINTIVGINLGSGGLKINGTANNRITDNQLGVGGSVFGGSAIVGVIVASGTGSASFGVTTSGESRAIYRPIGTGGTNIGGNRITSTIYNSIGSGGLVTSGTAPQTMVIKSVFGTGAIIFTTYAEPFEPIQISVKSFLEQQIGGLRFYPISAPQDEYDYI